jgi:glycerol-3-phosphate acyltransferase PlsY
MMPTIASLALALLAYLSGSIPFSLLVARAWGVDLRVSGSGNVGAANVWRTCGFSAFALAMGGDMLKGASANHCCTGARSFTACGGDRRCGSNAGSHALDLSRFSRR